MILVLDVGATRTRIAVSEDGAALGKPVILPTDQDFGATLDVFKIATRKLLSGAPPERVAVGIPGVLNGERSALTWSPNLARWVGEPIRDALEDALGAPVLLENDAALAGLGEAVRGAGQGHRISVYLTISTGVGGARITDGAIDARAHGFEPGWHIVDAETSRTLEETISGSAVQKRFGARPETIRDERAWEDLARNLAIGIHNASVFWSPDVIILGGSMILGDPAIALERVEAYRAALPMPFPERPPIKKAALGDSAGLYGALLLSR